MFDLLTPSVCNKQRGKGHIQLIITIVTDAVHNIMSMGILNTMNNTVC